MPNSIESLLANLTTEVRNNTESYIRLESTLKLELEGLREDYAEVKEAARALASTQANLGERMIANETRISDLQELRRDVTQLATSHGRLESRVDANAPVRTPWPTIMSALVALGALLYAFFGK